MYLIRNEIGEWTLAVDVAVWLADGSVEMLETEVPLDDLIETEWEYRVVNGKFPTTQEWKEFRSLGKFLTALGDRVEIKADETTIAGL